jgi:hypothetical protein
MFASRGLFVRGMAISSFIASLTNNFISPTGFDQVRNLDHTQQFCFVLTDHYRYRNKIR